MRPQLMLGTAAYSVRAKQSARQEVSQAGYRASHSPAIWTLPHAGEQINQNFGWPNVWFRACPICRLFEDCRLVNIRNAVLGLPLPPPAASLDVMYPDG